MEKLKKRNTETPHTRADAKTEIECSKDAFLNNPAASATDFTGITQTIPETELEANSYCDLMGAPVTSKDGAEKYKK